MKKKCLIIFVIFITLSIVQAQSCADSDGVDTTTKGYVEENGKIFDSCEKTFSLNDISYEVKENICINGERETINLPCEYQCQNGKCINKAFLTNLREQFSSYFKKDYGVEEEVIINCIKQTALDSLILTGLQGGYLSPDDYIETTSTIISYGYKDNKIKLITQKDLEKELETYMNIMLEYCIDSNYQILDDLVDEKPKVDVRIKDDKVSYSVKQKVKKNREKINIKYNYDVPVKLGKILDGSMKIMNGQTVREPGMNIMINSFDKDVKVFSMIDREFVLDDVPYTFRFAVERFNELGESKSGFLNNIFDWFGIYGGVPITPYEVEVPTPESVAPRIEPRIQKDDNVVAKPSPYCTKTLLQKCEEISNADLFSFIPPIDISFVETPEEKLDKEKTQCNNRFDRGIESGKDALRESQSFIHSCILKIDEQVIKGKPIPNYPAPNIPNDEINKEIEFTIARIGTQLFVVGWRLSGEKDWVPLQETILDPEIRKKIGAGNAEILSSIGNNKGIIGDLMDKPQNQLDFPRELKNSIGDREHNDCFYHNYGNVADNYKDAITELEYVRDNCPETSNEASMALSELYTSMGNFQKSNINYRTLIKKLEDTEEKRTEDEIASRIDIARLRMKIAVENNLKNAENNQKEAGSLLAESTRELNQALEQINEIIEEINSELSKNPGDSVFEGLLKEAINLRDSIAGRQETPELKKEVLDLLDSRIKSSKNSGEIEALESLRESIDATGVRNSREVIKKYLKDNVIPETQLYINQMEERIAYLQAKSDNAKNVLPNLESQLKSAKEILLMIDEETGTIDTPVGRFSGYGASQIILTLKKREQELEKSISDTKLSKELIDKEIAELTKEIEDENDQISRIVQEIDSLTGEQEKLRLLILHSYDRCIAGKSGSVIGMVDSKYNLADFDGRSYFDDSLQRLEEIFLNGNLLLNPVGIMNSYEQAGNKLVDLSQRQSGIMVVDILIRNEIAEEFLEASDKERENMLYELYEKSNGELTEKQMAEGRRRAERYVADFKFTIANDPSLLLLIFNGDPLKLKNYFEGSEGEIGKFFKDYYPEIYEKNFKRYSGYTSEDLIASYDFQNCVDLTEFEKGFFSEIAHGLNLATLALIMVPGAQAGSLSRVIPYATSETSLASSVISGIRATEEGTVILEGIIAGKGKLGKIAARSWLLRDSGIVTRVVCRGGALGSEIFVADAFEKLTGIPHSSSLMFGFLNAWGTFDAGIAKALKSRENLKIALEASKGNYEKNIFGEYKVDLLYKRYITIGKINVEGTIEPIQPNSLILSKQGSEAGKELVKEGGKTAFIKTIVVKDNIAKVMREELRHLVLNDPEYAALADVLIMSESEAAMARGFTFMTLEEFEKLYELYEIATKVQQTAKKELRPKIGTPVEYKINDAYFQISEEEPLISFRRVTPTSNLPTETIEVKFCEPLIQKP